MKLALFIVFFFFALSSFSQKQLIASGIVVSINASFKLSEVYSLKSNLEARDLFSLTENSGFISTDSRRSDLLFVLDRKVGTFGNVSTGLMYRLSNEENAWRLMQQIGYKQRLNSRLKSIAHRFRLDETFRSSSTEIRGRYRLGIELPFQGYQLDAGEKYFAFTTEYLAKTRSNQFSNELRITPKFGQLFRNGNKGELGFDFRYDAPLTSSKEKLFLIQFNYFFSE